MALAIGVGAGIIDRRRDTDSSATEPTDLSPTTTTTTSTTTTSTTVPPLVPDDIPAGVIAIGAAYMAERPEEADLPALLTLLPSPDGDVAAAARAGVAADFEAGDTVVLDGWVLATSEARAAAVLALVCTDPC